MDIETKLCSKSFPKPFCNETNDDQNSFPTYRRRSIINGGHTFKKTINNDFIFDNSWVVPYNPYLLLKYNCHMNLEICSTISSVKYLYKYVYKGDDKANVSIVSNNEQQIDINNIPNNNEPININEIKKYTTARYIGACNAMWRIFGYEMEERSPNVIRLQLHLPNQQQIFFVEGQEQEALINERNNRTMFTAYFNQVYLEQINPLNLNEIGYNHTRQLYPQAKDLTYQDFPNYYSWNTKDKLWNRRKRPHMSECVGRMFTTSPTAGELFYLRILLTKRKGISSFNDMLTVNNVQYISFKETSNILGYLINDNEWNECLQEASNYMLPVQLRDLIVTIFLYNEISNPLLLWDTFKNVLSEDFAITRLPIRSHVNRSDHCQALYYINDSIFKLSNSKKSLWEIKLNDHTRTTDFFYLP